MERYDLLENILRKETEEYKNLFDICCRQKEAIVKNNTAMVSSLVEQQQASLTQIERTEAERLQLMDEIGDGKAKKLSDILMYVEGAQGNRLRQCAQELTHTVTQLQSVERLNKMLIDTQLQYASYSIYLLTGAGKTLNTYSGSGTISETNPEQSLIDQTV